MMDWAEILACPTCLSNLTGRYYSTTIPYLFCRKCGKTYVISEGIPIFPDPPFDRREYDFEVKRYNRIARNLPEEYSGLDDSRPKVRAEMFKSRIGKIPTYLNIGQGFGQLEALMPNKTKVCLDQSIEFLRFYQKRGIPNSYLVMGFAERMPFKSKIFPCVVSDSVFQTVVDQREFLLENVRVLKNGGLLLLAITYKWNYPRKPQLFPAENPGLLLKFLDELGVKAKAEYYNLERQEKTYFYEKGDYLLVEGFKEEKGLW